MLEINYTTQFKKDFKRIKKQHKDFSILQFVIEELVNKKLLDEKYKNHPLIGNWKHHSECHLEPDWLLIYRISDNQLFLERTGSHSDLFR